MDAPARQGPGAGRVVALIVGSVALLIAAALLVSGLVLVVVDRTQRDADGFFMSGSDRYTTAGYALSTRELTISSEVPGWLLDRMGRVRIEATPQAGRPDLFIGIAARGDVDAYLAGVEHAVVTDVHGSAVTTEALAGGRAPAAPATETFWVASTSGGASRTLTWDVRRGSWSVVVMNADASRGVSVDARVGADTGLLILAGLVALVVGALLLAGGVTLVWVGARSRRAPAPAVVTGPAAPMAAFAAPEQPAWRLAPATPEAAFGAPPQSAPPATVPAYPVTLDGRLEQPGRFLWLVKWLLLLPHYLVLAVLLPAFFVLTAVALVAILVTGRYPRGIFEFNVGVLRWMWRVAFYGYGALGTDRYPPFSLGEEPEYPATLTVPYPERLSRGLVLVKWWLLAIPQYLVIALIAGGGGALGGGLVGLLSLVAGVLLLATGVYPAEIFRLVVGLDRWVVRVVAYAALMRDEYPPFRLDLDPQPPSVARPAAPTTRPLGHGI